MKKRGGAERRPSRFGEVFGLGSVLHNCERRVRAESYNTVYTISNPTRAVLTWPREPSVIRVQARRIEEIQAAHAEHAKDKRLSRGDVTQRGGVGGADDTHSPKDKIRGRVAVAGKRLLKARKRLSMVVVDAVIRLSELDEPMHMGHYRVRSERQLREEVTREFMSKRGGGGFSSFIQKWRRDGGLRTRRRVQRNALGAHLGRVRRWLTRNRAHGRQSRQPGSPADLLGGRHRGRLGVQLEDPDGSAGPSRSIAQNTDMPPAVPYSPTPRSTGSGSTAPFPPYEDPTDKVKRSPSAGSRSCVPHCHQYRERRQVLERGEVLDSGGPSQPAPLCAGCDSPDAKHSCSNLVVGGVQSPRNIRGQRRFSRSRSRMSSSSESSLVSSIRSRGLWSMRRLWLRDIWELHPMDFRPFDVDRLRSRSFDASWLKSIRGRAWLETQQDEQSHEAEHISASLEASSSSGADDYAVESSSSHFGDSEEGPSGTRNGHSAEALLNSRSGPSVQGSSPSSYKSSNYTTPNPADPALRVVWPMGGVQGTRTLSLNSLFDNVPDRRMGSWFTSRPPHFDEMPLKRPRQRSQDIYGSTPPRNRSPEHVAPDQRDQPTISSVPTEVNDFDNQVLNSINHLFRPSVDRILHPAQTSGFNMPEWESPHRPSILDSSDHQSDFTGTSTRFPSISSEITPATTAGEASRAEDHPETEDTPLRDNFSDSRDAPSTEDNPLRGDEPQT